MAIGISDSGFGVITLIGSTLLYVRFLLGGISMVMAVCTVGILQLGTFFLMVRFLSKRANAKVRSRVVLCFIPIMAGYILNSLIPLLLYSDSIADGLWDYFSVNFIPASYEDIKLVTGGFDFRVAPKVGIAGGVASVILFSYLMVCGKGLISFFTPYVTFYQRIKPVISGWDICASVMTLIVIVAAYTPLMSEPMHSLREKQKEYERIVAHNKVLHEERKERTVDLSVKGIRLGISGETAWGYLTALKEKNEPSKLKFDLTVEYPEAIYDRLIGTTYNGVFPYKLRSGTFEGVNLKGNHYKVSTTLDNIPVGLDLYVLNDSVSAIKVYGFDYTFGDYDRLLALYKKKYGEPEVIKDYSPEKTYYGGGPYRSKGKADRYVWDFKNGRIEISEFGIVYLSDTLLSRVRNELKENIANSERAEKERVEMERRLQLRENSLRLDKEREDSLRRVRNHENVINEI